uniref:Alpha-taxilin n=1 Tax=Arion vulgaris TaxID=1028688 RepID=A0A0B7ANX4_9EUPU
MSTPACESQSIDQFSIAEPVVDEVCPIPIEDVDSGIKSAVTKTSKMLRNPMDEVDAEPENGESESASGAVGPVSAPVTRDSELGPSTIQNSSENLTDGIQQLQENSIIDKTNAIVAENPSKINNLTEVTNTETSVTQSSSKGDARIHQNGAKTKLGKEAAKEEKKEEKKKGKKKEDKSVEYILRALNSLQSPEEKLAALCKKYADLHEEHRVLQTSSKTQQRTLTVVSREKDQLQSEHTKAMLTKGKLESLCRELQKHNKIIKDESIKRAKEDDEKRKEISAQFNVTIGEIQNQMSDNTEKNNRLRKENDNLAEQLRTFISQCQGREEHVKKLQEHHDLEKKLAAARLLQAEAIFKDVEERSNKEKELMLFKLTEITKKSQLTESQLELYKSKYDEFSDLHTRSSETFQKYKTEMDKMTKRIKKLEKDGLQWKSKWESSSKSLIEQYEARSKSEQETMVCIQKIKRLESLCRALQAELHGKKVVQQDVEKEENEASTSDQHNRNTAEQIASTETGVNSSHELSAPSLSQSSSDSSSEPHSSTVKVVTETIETAQSGNLRDDGSSAAVPVNSPVDSSSDQCSHDTTQQISSLELAVNSSHPSSALSSASPPVSSTELHVGEVAESVQRCPQEDGVANDYSTNVDGSSVSDTTNRHKDPTSSLDKSLLPAESVSGGETEEHDKLNV